MSWSSSALGIRPNASSTRQTVCYLVTPSPQNVVFYPFSFLSLAHSSARDHSATPLLSYSSALFSKNTGGGYTLRNSPPVFKRLRTLAPLAPNRLFEGSDFCEGAWLALSLPAVAGCLRLQARWSPVDAPLARRCFSTGNALDLFSIHVLTRLFSSQPGGTPTPSARFAFPANFLSVPRYL